MTHDGRRTAGDPARTEYAGAVYGSLLAASVIVGSSPRKDPTPAFALVVLLIATGLVFWFAHVYARLAGERAVGIPVRRADVRAVGAAEWPLAQAAVPPAAVACAGWLLGLPDVTTAWLALVTALGGQVGWAVAALVQAGARPRTYLTAGLVNLLLGMVIVSLKFLLAH
ncbi:cytochrome c oxidase subunit 2A [Actinomadura sp. 9N407]|uniref:cytochrome c oxidase subunit 2A n=1 Tax=Actinomadura sp. 9N407 TaxID=3375154 RepID=UPI00378FA7FB